MAAGKQFRLQKGCQYSSNRPFSISRVRCVIQFVSFFNNKLIANKIFISLFNSNFNRFSSCVNKDLYNEILEKADTIEMKNNFRKTCDPVLERLEETTERRFIKSHLPLSLLPPDLLTCGAKVLINSLVKAKYIFIVVQRFICPYQYLNMVSSGVWPLINDIYRYVN